MSKEQGVLKRLLVSACPQFLEDWFGAAGSRFKKGLTRLSHYNRDHAQIGEKLDEVPDLLWKAAEGAASAQHAKAEANYAKAENDRMEAELRRRTLEAKTRHECAKADKAEAEAAVAKIKEMQARLELFKQLRAAGVSVTTDTSVNVVVTQAEPRPPLEVVEILEPDEVNLIQPNLIEVKCPQFEGLPADAKLTFLNWGVSVGSRVSKEEPLGEIAASTSPVSTFRIPSPTTGVVAAIFAPENSLIRPGQLIATILTVA
jgi:biotin carboxyl carrier protein